MLVAATADHDALAAVLVLVGAIERRAEGDAAILGFQAALRRRGAEIAAEGGPAAVAGMLRAVIASSEPHRADAREAILRTSWADLPSKVGRA